MTAPGLAQGVAFFFAAQALHFQIDGARGKPVSSVTIEAGAADSDGWRALTVRAKGKTKDGAPVLVWPFDSAAKAPDGPEPIPAIVIPQGDPQALANTRVLASIAAPVALGVETVEHAAARTGFAPGELTRAFASLEASPDPFEKGVGLLYAGKAADAVAPLAVALRQRQRQLTRIPSEIYPAAALYGEALYQAGKFDDAAVAFLAALKERPSATAFRKRRADALIKAGKPEAAEP